MQYEKYLRLTIFENGFNYNKSYAKLDYIYVNENGVQDKDFGVHHRRVEIDDLDRTIDNFIKQTNMTEYQLERDGFLVNLDYHRAKNFDRKKKVMDKISIKPKKTTQELNTYQVRGVPKKTIVSNLKVRYQNVENILKDGMTVLAIAGSIFVVGKAFEVINAVPKDEMVSFHKVSERVDKTSQKVINGRGRAEDIIGKLVRGKYHDVKEEDISFLEQYYTSLGQANNDEDANFFEHDMSKYLEQGLNKNEKYIYDRLENLVNGMYVKEGMGNRYHYDSENTLSYAIYAMSLVVGGEDKLSYESSIKSNYVASTAEGAIYYQMRPEYKLPILINLRETLRTRDISLKDLPYRVYKIGSYDFNKDEFIRKLDDQILLVKTQLESMCNSKTRGRK